MHGATAGLGNDVIVDGLEVLFVHLLVDVLSAEVVLQLALKS